MDLKAHAVSRAVEARAAGARAQALNRGVRGRVQEATADTLHLSVPGLTQPVEIIQDRWGVAHIYARNEHDLFLAQGYNAARDRLFQFELWRRQATGTVAELLGPRELDRDIGTRLFMFRGNLTQELNHYHPHGEAIVRAYVDGVNAYIAETERDSTLLPLEFKLLGTKPARWTPAVVISRHQGLLGNIGSELSHGRAVAVLGPERVTALESFEPGTPDLALDTAIDGALLSADILHLYSAFRTPVRFQPSDIAEAYRGDDATHRRLARLASPVSACSIAGPPDDPTLDPFACPPVASVDIGSNNWVVSGRLTQSGYPLMSNDPHRAQSAPSLRYWVHLVAPGWNVLGGGEPEIPGVSIGHNEYGAWGLTVFETDGEDLYVYRTNAANAAQYWYNGRWEDMTVIKDTIAVKGAAPAIVDLKYTRHGPVVYEDAEHHVAYAVRAAWREIGGAPYLASLRMDQARTWDEFRDACNYSNIPGENMVWADRAGNVGWQAVGIAPIRPNWSGLVPVPGDGRYEWAGYLPIKAKPHVANPPAGFWVTANNDLIPHDYPYRDAVGWEWADPYRWARASEVLASGRKHTVMDMMRLQTDELSIPARTLVPLLRHVTVADRTVEQARKRLLTWDYVLGQTSVAAGIYAAWERRLQRNVTDLFVPEAGRQFIGSIAMSNTVTWLLAPPGALGRDPIAGRDSLLVASLAEAVNDLKQKLGPDMAQWQYGQAQYHHALIRHPLSPAVTAAIRQRLDVGPLPRGGNGYTLNATGSGDNQTSGASFRIIVDTGDWDASVGMNTPGQTGNPDDPHYRDLFPLWAADRFFPAFFSRDKVESVAGLVMELSPEH